MGPEAQTIPQLIAQRRREDADVQAVVSDDRVITYAELDVDSRAIAARLVAAGATKAARVGLMMPNGIGWATVALAVMRTGATLVPLSTLLRPPELLAQIGTAAVTELFMVPSFRDRDYLQDLEAIAPGVRALGSDAPRNRTLPSLRHVWTMDDLPVSAASDGLVDAMEQKVRPADDMAIMFTSGSRGVPKGVIHTHGNALRATRAGLDSRCVRKGSRLYIPMPFFWMGGFGGGLLSALAAGATLLTETIPEPARTIRFLERERVTLFRGWPDQAARIAAHPSFPDADLSSLSPGSLDAVLPRAQRPEPGARATLFGMTESFGPYCGARLDVDLPASEHGSCGRAFSGVEVRITDLEGGSAVEPGMTGQIELRGPNLMSGICGRARPDVFSVEGFYQTGDLGTLDAEGYLRYEGRLDDMLKVRGATVYPIEVEAGVRAIPGVERVYVTNVVDDDGRECVAAAVVGAACPDLASLIREARDRLSSFKVPTVWLVMRHLDEVPMSPTGKVDKVALQDLLRTRGVSARSLQEGRGRA